MRTGADSFHFLDIKKNSPATSSRSFSLHHASQIALLLHFSSLGTYRSQHSFLALLYLDFPS